MVRIGQHEIRITINQIEWKPNKSVSNYEFQKIHTWLRGLRETKEIAYRFRDE